MPLHRWSESRLKLPNLAAALLVLMVSLIVDWFVVRESLVVFIVFLPPP